MSRKDSGLTLIELLITTTIIGISYTAVVPYFNGFFDHVRGYSTTHALRQTMVLARSEAIKRNTVVRICPTDNGVSCSSTSEWQNGWITYVPDQGQTALMPENIILDVSEPKTGIKIIKNGRENTVRFSSRGSIGLNRSFSICSSKTDNPISRLVLYRTGRIRIADDDIDCKSG